MRHLLILCLLLIGFAGVALGQLPRAAQTNSNLRQKMLYAKTDSLQLDSLSLVPHSVFVLGIDTAAYQIDYINAILRWKQKPLTDSVFIKYRVFSTRMNAVVKHFTYDSVMNNFIGQPFVFNDNNNSDHFFDFGTINYSGSFGRGLSFGNSQDAVVTSNLNLQLNGFLADSIEIAAAITDNNIPIQPDGTTQQLNEFDRIFLQFKKKGWQLGLGDIDIRQNKSYFLNFYKRLQGAAFENTTNLSATTTNTTLLSGSIAKGKFTRNIFQGLEGNQGPYRLTGANNEFFFVVLANTERVFIDGELLQRGEDQDYVINYNTAEITFTPRRMITKDKRIQVEFEYADRNYLNANLYFSNLVNFNNKVKLTISAFNNSDARNSPINQTLDKQQIKFLDSIGGNTSQAYYPIATRDTFSVGKILYKKIDSVYNGGLSRDSVFVYSTHPDSAQYSLSFIDVGPGNGDYLPDFNGANGKVYKWIAPVNGVKQGRYLPATFLVAPKKQQLVSMGIDYAISKRTSVVTELAYSNYDVNTFSSKDNGNNKGYAAKTTFKNSTPLQSTNNLQLNTDFSYEYVAAKFKPLERLRNVEFTRDWGLNITEAPQTENIITAGAQLQDKNNNSLRYQLTHYKRGSSFNGIRNSIYHYHAIKGWKLNNQFNLSTTSSNLQQGYFLRPMIDVSKLLSKLRNYTISFNYSVEHNEVKNKLSDSVTATSFSFTTTQVALKSSELKPNRWGIIFFTRADQYPFGKQLVKADKSQNLNLFGELTQNPKHRFMWNITYRNLQIVQAGITNQKADQSLLGRSKYEFNEWNGLLTGEVLYEVGAGQEQRRDFAFLEVPAGRGEFTWIDYNNDGVQQLNEFEIALFADQAKYIRIFTPTNDFVKANYNTFNYSFNINPKAVINTSKAKGVSKLVSRVNFQSALQIFKKEVASGLVQLNPFKTPLQDSSLINLNAIFINTFSFNRFSTVWGVDVNNSRNRSKALLTYGLESRRFDEWSIKGRFNLNKTLQLDATLRKGINQLTTASFENRNFNIQQSAIEPRISYTKGTVLRLLAGYKFSNKKNTIGNKETFTSHALNTEVKYNILQNSSLLAKFTYADIQFPVKQSINTTVGFNMLEGLQPGKNFLWNLELTKRISNSIEFNIQYEGRKPGAARVVNIGRASIRALL